ncbi:MAG: AAA family ATPase, partial [Candidatus Omnitrophica bacterium]|nr:AAA family ATPase [Candidatus Omnitrophota bacterium]
EIDLSKNIVRKTPKGETPGQNETIIKSYQRAQNALGGLIADFTVIDGIIYQERVTPIMGYLRDLIDEKGVFSGCGWLTDEDKTALAADIMQKCLQCVIDIGKRGFIPTDAKFTNFGVRGNGEVVMYDLGVMSFTDKEEMMETGIMSGLLTNTYRLLNIVNKASEDSGKPYFFRDGEYAERMGSRWARLWIEMTSGRTVPPEETPSWIYFEDGDAFAERFRREFQKHSESRDEHRRITYIPTDIAKEEILHLIMKAVVAGRKNAGWGAVENGSVDIVVSRGAVNPFYIDGSGGYEAGIYGEDYPAHGISAYDRDLNLNKTGSLAGLTGKGGLVEIISAAQSRDPGRKITVMDLGSGRSGFFEELLNTESLLPQNLKMIGVNHPGEEDVWGAAENRLYGDNPEADLDFVYFDIFEGWETYARRGEDGLPDSPEGNAVRKTAVLIEMVLEKLRPEGQAHIHLGSSETFDKRWFNLVLENLSPGVREGIDTAEAVKGVLHIKKKTAAGEVLGQWSGPKPGFPRGCIKSVFEMLVELNITHPSEALSAEEIAGKIGRAVNTVAPDIRALEKHLKLINAIEGGTAGRPEKKYFVPRHIAARADGLVPLLARFRGKEDLRPSVSTLQKVYETGIKPLFGPDAAKEHAEEETAKGPRGLKRFVRGLKRAFFSLSGYLPGTKNFSRKTVLHREAVSSGFEPLSVEGVPSSGIRSLKFDGRENDLEYSVKVLRQISKTDGIFNAMFAGDKLIMGAAPRVWEGQQLYHNDIKDPSLRKEGVSRIFRGLVFGGETRELGLVCPAYPEQDRTGLRNDLIKLARALIELGFPPDFKVYGRAEKDIVEEGFGGSTLRDMAAADLPGVKAPQGEKKKPEKEKAELVQKSKDIRVSSEKGIHARSALELSRVAERIAKELEVRVTAGKAGKRVYCEQYSRMVSLGIEDKDKINITAETEAASAGETDKILSEVIALMEDLLKDEDALEGRTSLDPYFGRIKEMAVFRDNEKGPASLGAFSILPLFAEAGLLEAAFILLAGTAVYFLAKRQKGGVKKFISTVFSRKGASLGDIEREPAEAPVREFPVPDYDMRSPARVFSLQDLLFRHFAGYRSVKGVDLAAGDGATTRAVRGMLLEMYEEALFFGIDNSFQKIMQAEEEDNPVYYFDVSSITEDMRAMGKMDLVTVFSPYPSDIPKIVEKAKLMVDEDGLVIVCLSPEDTLDLYAGYSVFGAAPADGIWEALKGFYPVKLEDVSDSVMRRRGNELIFVYSPGNDPAAGRMPEEDNDDVELFGNIKDNELASRKRKDFYGLLLGILNDSGKADKLACFGYSVLLKEVLAELGIRSEIYRISSEMFEHFYVFTEDGFILDGSDAGVILSIAGRQFGNPRLAEIIPEEQETFAADWLSYAARNFYMKKGQADIQPVGEDRIKLHLDLVGKLVNRSEIADMVKSGLRFAGGTDPVKRAYAEYPGKRQKGRGKPATGIFFPFFWGSFAAGTRALPFDLREIIKGTDPSWLPAAAAIMAGAVVIGSILYFARASAGTDDAEEDDPEYERKAQTLRRYMKSAQANGFRTVNVRYIFPSTIPGKAIAEDIALETAREAGLADTEIVIPAEYFPKEEKDHICSADEAVRIIVQELATNTYHTGDAEFGAVIGIRRNRRENCIDIVYGDLGEGNPEAEKNIGKRYTTTGRSERGYGLRLIDFIVRKTNGRMVFSSRQKEGTNIKISIPLPEKPYRDHFLKYTGDTLRVSKNTFDHPGLSYRMIEYLEKKGGALEGKKVWDLGTGSGILGIYAARKGADVVATDIKDTSAGEEGDAVFNVRKAGLKDKIEVRPGPFDEPLKREETFDLILADPPVFGSFADLAYSPFPRVDPDEFDEDFRLIKDLFASLPRRLNPGGKLILLYPSSETVQKRKDKKGINFFDINGLRQSLAGRGIMLKETPAGDMFSVWEARFEEPASRKEEILFELTVEGEGREGSPEALEEAAERVSDLITEKAEIFGKYAYLAEDLMLELLFNTAEHGGGGKFTVTAEFSGEGDVEKIRFTAEDRGPGLRASPNDIVSKKLASGGADPRGMGMRCFTFDLSSLVIESNGKRWERISRDPSAPGWYVEKGHTDVVRGVKITAVLDMDEEVSLEMMGLKAEKKEIPGERAGIDVVSAGRKELTAYIYAQKNEEPGALFGDEAGIRGIWLDPAFRGMGISRQIVRRFAAEYPQVELMHSSVRNPLLIKLCESELGFEPVAPSPSGAFYLKPLRKGRKNSSYIGKIWIPDENLRMEFCFGPQESMAEGFDVLDSEPEDIKEYGKYYFNTVYHRGLPPQEVPDGSPLAIYELLRRKKRSVAVEELRLLTRGRMRDGHLSAETVLRDINALVKAGLVRPHGGNTGEKKKFKAEPVSSVEYAAIRPILAGLGARPKAEAAGRSAEKIRKELERLREHEEEKAEIFVNELEAKLGYKFRDRNNLFALLDFSDKSAQVRKTITEAGAHLFKFLMIEYALTEHPEIDHREFHDFINRTQSNRARRKIAEAHSDLLEIYRSIEDTADISGSNFVMAVLGSLFLDADLKSAASAGGPFLKAYFKAQDDMKKKYRFAEKSLSPPLAEEKEKVIGLVERVMGKKSAPSGTLEESLRSVRHSSKFRGKLGNEIDAVLGDAVQDIVIMKKITEAYDVFSESPHMGYVGLHDLFVKDKMIAKLVLEPLGYSSSHGGLTWSETAYGGALFEALISMIYRANGRSAGKGFSEAGRFITEMFRLYDSDYRRIGESRRKVLGIENAKGERRSKSIVKAPPSTASGRTEKGAVIGGTAASRGKGKRKRMTLVSSDSSPPVILLMGLPGAGKGTLGSYLSAECGLPYISVGDLIRRSSKAGKTDRTSLEDNAYVYDELLDGALDKADISKGLILDISPRTDDGVDYLRSALRRRGLDLAAIIELTLSKRTSAKRMRRSARKRGRPWEAGKRAIEKRHEFHRSFAVPQIEKYRKEGLVSSIDAEVSPQEVRKRALKALEKKKLLKRASQTRKNKKEGKDIFNMGGLSYDQYMDAVRKAARKGASPEEVLAIDGGPENHGGIKALRDAEEGSKKKALRILQEAQEAYARGRVQELKEEGDGIDVLVIFREEIVSPITALGEKAGEQYPSELVEAVKSAGGKVPGEAVIKWDPSEEGHFDNIRSLVFNSFGVNDLRYKIYANGSLIGSGGGRRRTGKEFFSAFNPVMQGMFIEIGEKRKEGEPDDEVDGNEGEGTDDPDGADISLLGGLDYGQYIDAVRKAAESGATPEEILAIDGGPEAHGGVKALAEAREGAEESAEEALSEEIKTAEERGILIEAALETKREIGGSGACREHSVELARRIISRGMEAVVMRHKEQLHYWVETGEYICDAYPEGMTKEYADAAEKAGDRRFLVIPKDGDLAGRLYPGATDEALSEEAEKDARDETGFYAKKRDRYFELLKETVKSLVYRGLSGKEIDANESVRYFTRRIEEFDARIKEAGQGKSAERREDIVSLTGKAVDAYNRGRLDLYLENRLKLEEQGFEVIPVLSRGLVPDMEGGSIVYREAEKASSRAAGLARSLGFSEIKARAVRKAVFEAASNISKHTVKNGAPGSSAGLVCLRAREENKGTGKTLEAVVSDRGLWRGPDPQEQLEKSVKSHADPVSYDHRGMAAIVYCSDSLVIEKGSERWEKRTAPVRLVRTGASPGEERGTTLKMAWETGSHQKPESRAEPLSEPEELKKIMSRLREERPYSGMCREHSMELTRRLRKQGILAVICSSGKHWWVETPEYVLDAFPEGLGPEAPFKEDGGKAEVVLVRKDSETAERTYAGHIDRVLTLRAELNARNDRLYFKSEIDSVKKQIEHRKKVLATGRGEREYRSKIRHQLAALKIRLRQAEKALTASEHRMVLKGDRYSVAARQLLDSIIIQAYEAEKQGKAVIMGVDISWLPEPQRGYAQRLIDTIGRKPFKYFRLVRGNGSDLAGKILITAKGLEKENINAPLSNIVIIGEHAVINSDAFSAFKGKNNGKDGAFFAGIKKPDGFSETGYARLLEIMDIALRTAFEDIRQMSDPGVEVVADPENGIRSYIFIPYAEPMELEELKKVYDNQVKVMIAA